MTIAAPRGCGDLAGGRLETVCRRRTANRRHGRPGGRRGAAPMAADRSGTGPRPATSPRRCAGTWSSPPRRRTTSARAPRRGSALRSTALPSAQPRRVTGSTRTTGVPVCTQAPPPGTVSRDGPESKRQARRPRTHTWLAVVPGALRLLEDADAWPAAASRTRTGQATDPGADDGDVRGPPVSRARRAGAEPLLPRRRRDARTKTALATPSTCTAPGCCCCRARVVPVDHRPDREDGAAAVATYLRKFDSGMS